ncbi:Protein RTA1 [Cyphellophora attinorum]|uniref:Protein RTA1 n=1 Tax=Cyphellophora attinorum TaxID=1664694 RepID=A0A0N1P0S0_9EURO|nr:Protein RTA1 [Phialophora attinorum]KPI42686.1 Protein RTA1 [Phialophora attinorum]
MSGTVGVHPVQGSFYIYAPVKGVSIVFAIFFLVSGIAHIYQNNIQRRSWRIGFLLPWAALLFTAGFSLREYGAYHYDKLPEFIASTVLLFVAPPVYQGANYFIFGRALYYLPYLSIIHPGRVWTTFVVLDSIDGALAGNGAALAANQDNSPSKIRLGFTLVKVSLFLLLGMFCAFLALVISFHRRAVAAGVFNYKMKVIIYEMYISSFLICIRNCFRAAAAFYSWNSIANGKEWPFWVFEALPMLANTVMLNIYPPAKYLPADHKVYLAVDGTTELHGPGMVDKRPFLVTLFDPFDLVGLLKGSDNKNRFWEKDGIGGPKDEAAGVNEVTSQAAKHKNRFWARFGTGRPKEEEAGATEVMSQATNPKTDV